MFYIPFIVIVDSWNVNKISVSISISMKSGQVITSHSKPSI